MGAVCALCGSDRADRYRRSSAGALFCSVHPWCSHCRTAHLTMPCHEEVHAVRSAAEAFARSSSVLGDLKSVGIELPTVPVSVVMSMPGSQDGRCINTGSVGFRPTRSSRIEVKSGLGPTRFGHVVAHEHTHALLHLRDGPSRDPMMEEGLCELVAVVWLTQRSTSPEILHDVWNNPHPLYGNQMRRLVRLARRDGVGTVLDRVLHSGRPE